MAFNHRKLLTDSVNNSSLTQICAPFCDPTKSVYGLLPPFPPDPFTLDDEDHPPAHKHKTLPHSLIIFLSIVVTIFCLFLVFTIFKCLIPWYRSRSRRRSTAQPQSDETHDEFLDEDHGPVLDHPIWYIRTIGLQPSVISAITICKYRKGEGIVEGTDCSVCLNEFEEGETLRLLPKCNHAFHIPCIDTWLGSHTNCPMCRAGIIINIAGSPSTEQVLNNSNLVEDTQVVILENRGESEGGREDEDSEFRAGIEEEDEEQQIGNEINCDEENIDHLEVNKITSPMRRSVSVDFLSIPRISAAVINANPGQFGGHSDRKIVKVNESEMGIVPKRIEINESSLKLVGSSSSGRSHQRGSSNFLKRSFSYSGKVLFSRHSSSQSRDSILPL